MSSGPSVGAGGSLSGGPASRPQKKRSSLEAGVVGLDGEEDVLVVRPLGGGLEVGRSCIHLTYKGKSILFDCGIHPGHRGEDSIPRGLHSLDVDLSEVDLCLVTHFHLDHVGALPYLTEKTNFKGAVFMTYPTWRVMKLLLSDYLRVGSVGADGVQQQQQQLFSEEDLRRCLAKCTCIRYHVEHSHKGIRFRCFPAGHVLGAAMFDVNIAGQKILYTGDFSCTDDRHLLPAKVPRDYHPDCVIMESTMGTRSHPNQERRERDLLKYIEQTLMPPGGARPGRVLIPIWALGRAQEIQLILDEHWGKHRRLQRFPIYYTSKMAKKAMDVYRTETQMMNDNVKSKRTNPFNFRFIRELSSVRLFNDTRPCVVLATPGMLQNGDSRFLLEQWCGDDANRILLCGYAVENTLAHRIRSKAPESIDALDGRRIPFRCSVNEVSFNGHADVRETTQFVKTIDPKDIILVHGARQQCLDLRKHLKFRGYPAVQTPENGQPVFIYPVEKKIARFMGAIAEEPPQDGQRVDAVMIVEEFKHKILDLYTSPADAETFTRLSVSSIMQEQFVPYHYELDALLVYLRRMFDDVVPYTIETTFAGQDGRSQQEVAQQDKQAGSDGAAGVDKKNILQSASSALKQTQSSWVICGKVQLTHQPHDHRLCVQWESSPEGDMLADSIIALAMQVQVQMTSAPSTAPGNLESGRDSEASASTGSDWPQNDQQILSFFLRVYQERFGVDNVSLRTDKGTNEHLFRIEVMDTEQDSESDGEQDPVQQMQKVSAWCHVAYPLSHKLVEVTGSDSDLLREVQEITRNLQASILPISI